MSFRVGEGRANQQKIPPTVWSATPLLVNDTLYVSTPFYRILAVDPGSGRLKWAFDPHAVLKALTQPDLKTRGVGFIFVLNRLTGEPVFPIT